MDLARSGASQAKDLGIWGLCCDENCSAISIAVSAVIT